MTNSTATNSLKSISLKPHQWMLARRAAVQFLYQLQIHEQLFFQDRDVQIFFHQANTEVEIRQAVIFLVQETLGSLAQIDGLLGQAAKNWKLSRMARVDLAVLRICSCELLLRQDIPPAVVISDGVDIAQDFGSEHSRAFVNGVLDAVRKRLPSKEEGAVTEEVTVPQASPLVSPDY